jgi:predicted ribosomally synthesized peptide with SipW-like signal peptide
MKLKTVAMTGMMSLAGFGLIGVGAHAAFTQTTQSVQPITAGSMNVQLSTTVAGANLTNSGQTLTFPDPGPTGSSFVDVDPVTITNYSSFAVSEIALQVTDPDNLNTAQSAALDTETWACFYSDGELLVNEPLPTVEGYANAVVGGSISAGGTDSYTVVFYAGATDNGCGATFTGFSGGSYTTNEPYVGSPAFGTNSAAASLDNSAQGGVIDPTLTLTYTG